MKIALTYVKTVEQEFVLFVQINIHENAHFAKVLLGDLK